MANVLEYLSLQIGYAKHMLVAVTAYVYVFILHTYNIKRYISSSSMYLWHICTFRMYKPVASTALAELRRLPKRRLHITRYFQRFDPAGVYSRKARLRFLSRGWDAVSAWGTSCEGSRLDWAAELCLGPGVARCLNGVAETDLCMPWQRSVAQL